MWERISAYWNFRLPDDFTRQEVITLLGGASALTFFSVVMLHAFIPSPQPVTDVLLHALAISITYTVAFVVLIAGLQTVRLIYPAISINLWQFWLASFLTFTAGFYLSPIADWVTGDVKYHLHQDLTPDNVHFHFARMIPVWALITYIIAMLLQKRGLELELSALEAINASFSTDHPFAEPSNTISIQSGKTTHNLETKDISHISVIDHYSYVFLDGEIEQKIDVAVPLRDLEALLPPSFAKVHRSHLVNLEKITSLNRNSVTVGNYSAVLPVSRRNFSTVLAQLQARRSNEATSPGNHQG